MNARSSYGFYYFRVLLVVILFIQFKPGLFTSCADRSVGLENKYVIPDDRFKASSYSSNSYKPWRARISDRNGWLARTNSDPNDYLQIYLGYPYAICAVGTQGAYYGRVTNYKISLSLDGTNWIHYKTNGNIKTFAGNTDKNSIVKRSLDQRPLARYVRFVPTTFNNYKTMRVGIYGSLGGCEKIPLGMESGVIPDGKISASSAQNLAKNARLHYKGGSWCGFSTGDSNPHLQIDLGTPHLICAVSTQGNSMADKWVKTYQITMSNSGAAWTTYQENNTDRTFYGNYDHKTVVGQVMYNGIVTRHIRIVPKTFQTSTPCLRTEIYGYDMQTGCSSHSVGIPSSVLVPDHRFTATSFFSSEYLPHKSRLGASSAWAPNGNAAGQYLQVDLGDVFHVCAVATQGNGYYKKYEWVTKYKVLYSIDNNQWITYSDSSGAQKEFMGNTDRTRVVTNPITNPFKAKFVRVLPITSRSDKSMRIEFKGLPTACTSTLGLENSQIPDSQMTSSSSSDNYHTASHGRLYGSSSWCSFTSSNTAYIQVDLGQIKTVTGVATQGDHSLNKWVTSYYVSYSFDNRYWNGYKEGPVTKVFDGNTKRNDVKVNWLNRPIAARYVRVLPQTSSGGECLRLDLYGCMSVVTPKATLDSSGFTLPSTKGSSRTLTCSVLGQPTPDIQWFNNGTKINGATRLTLQVYFISAEQVLSSYNCVRQDSDTRAVVCNTSCTCRATYPTHMTSGGMSEARANITVVLNVPEQLIFQGVANKRSIKLSWTILTTTDDMGRIEWYTIRFNNQSATKYFYVRHPGSFCHLLYLKPYTVYAVSMKAISSSGHGLWSSWQNIKTQIDKPEGVPEIIYLFVKSSQGIQVNWRFTENDKLNGPLAGYTVTFTSSGGPKHTARVQSDVKTVTLVSLDKYTEYSITVLVRNTQYDGPESIPQQAKTKEDAPSCSPKPLTVKATTSTNIVITWTSLPQNTKCLNGVLKYYRVIYRKKIDGSTGSFQVDKSYSSQDISGLDKYTRYEIQILAFTVGDGPRSIALEETTLQDAPSWPLNLGGTLLPPLNDIRVPRLNITWKKPQQENGIITRYAIYYVYYSESSTPNIVNITNIGQLSYTMNVLGQTDIKFRIKASTIKEGPYTYYRYATIPTYPPAIAPKQSRPKKINETAFTIAWQPLPRDQSNGVITKYEVTWQLMSIGHRRRRSVDQSSTATTQGSQYTIYNLRLCAQYTVYVKGFTTAGPGPNSTVFIVTSQPGEPLNVMPFGKGKTNIDLKWDKPRGVSRNIKNYKITMKGFKSYWKGYKGVSEVFTEGGETNTKTFQNLKPGTRYVFWVISITECGESNKSVSTSVDTDIDAPVQPKGKPIKLQDNYNVTLWPVKPENGPISSYHVIVINGESLDVDSLPDVLHNYKNSKDKSQEYYIAAELKVDDYKSIPKQFPVGDDQKYGGYQNIPLKKGETYTIAERAVTVHNKIIYIGKAAQVATIHLTAENTGKDGESVSSPVTGPAIGGVFGVLLIFACVILGFVLYKRHHKPNDDRHESSIAMALDDIVDNEGQKRGSRETIDSMEEPSQYANQVNQVETDDIYDETLDNVTKPIAIRQFAEYVKSTKATDYTRLKQEFKHLPNAQLFSTSVAKIPENKKKNRYGNIVTYNHSRVIIERIGDKNSDYINASYIKGFDGSPKVYIAAQGPVPQTFPDFWQMIWEQNTSTIVMLTNLKEGNKTKCHQYWPDSKETYRDITVNNHKTEVFPDYIIRTLLLTKVNAEEKRSVLQFQFTVWPDKGVPHYATAVLGLRRKVKAKNPQNAGPVVVHCSAGVGRTGAYIVIDAMLDRAKKLRNIEISNYVAMIRKARPYMVQTDEQYVFIHLAVLEVLTCGNTEIQVHNLEIVINKLSSTSPSKKINGFTAEFERLNLVTADYVEDECDVGTAQENASKNRSPDVIALNSSRVLLSREDNTDQDTDYINASFVHAYRARNAFIVTQAPLANTIEDFWIMVANYEIRTIVMLNTIKENHEQLPQYWPQSGVQTYGHVTVEFLGTQDIGEIVSRRLKVTYMSSSINVQQLQHLQWANKYIPTNPQSVLDLLNEVEQSQRQSSNSAPVVVHCSNGVGRSGTFCAIASILERTKQEQVIDVFQVVKCIRLNRPGAVESLSQYIFCYQIIQKYLDSFSDYANFSTR